MKPARKYLIPAFVAAFALLFAVATPFVMADYGDGYAKYHKKHWAVQVSNAFEGNIPITEDSTHESLKKLINISLSEAASKYPDAKKAKLGIAENENGRYLVWKVIEITMDQDSGTKSMIIHIVDARVDSIDEEPATEDVTKEFDHSTKYTRHGDYKMSGHKIHGYYADMTPEEREVKRTQYKEMKEAFSTLSEEDQTAIKSHFHSMKKDGADMSQDREAKFAKLKAEMHAFMELPLNEKISYLKYFAQSLKNQE